MYATVEDGILYFKHFIEKDVYDAIIDNEETLGLIELATMEEYIVYRTDESCVHEHIIIVGNNKNKSLSLKAQYQLSLEFDEIFYVELEEK